MRLATCARRFAVSGVLLLGLGRPATAQLPPPTLLSITADAGLVTLTWTRAADHRTTYLADVGTAPGLSDLANGAPLYGFGAGSVGNVPAGAYYVRLRAALLGEVSVPSNEIQITVPGCPIPVGPTLSAQTVGQTATLSWNLSNHAPGCFATAFALEAGTAPGVADLGTLDIPDFHLTQRSFSSLPIGRYYVRGRASHPGFAPVASNEVVLDVLCAPPPDILNPGVRTVGNAAQFTWSVESSGGAAFSLFLDAGTRPGATDIGSLAIPADAGLGYNVAGAAGVYYTRFRAVNACGATTSSEVPVTLTSGCVAPDPIAFLDATSFTVAPPYDVTLQWDAPATGGLVLGYEMAAGTSPGAADLGAWTLDGRRTPPFARWTPTFRTPAQATYFTVLPANHCGPASRPADARAIAVACRTPPAPKTTFASVAGNTVTLAWDGTGELETSYRTFVEIGGSPGAADVAVSPTFGSYGRPTFVTTLPAGRYYARARRMSSFCDEVSNPSTEVTFVVP